ncbi:amidohydrolase [Alkaliphilus metalliredigens QYMF]|uniref:Amidohydrolase n=1 Tax=Alkaliphilus metalliredigens (strain QYMF) TaxID=293826 RepID=A6TUX1_ALKMQ|nr:amidohydrolase family protein [Alkaliphilus metalliredigens]ABR49989.1 amidohydrolase [Alkaliphilus metalliredigens QYMF]
MLIDAHIHIALNHLYNKQEWESARRETQIEWVRRVLKEYKKAGIYALRDGGDGIYASKLAREIAEEEGVIYKSPIYALYKQGHYGNFLGESITDKEDFTRTFKILLDHKLDHLKIILTGIVDFKKYGEVGETTFTLEELKYMVETAREHNIPVMVHANGKDGVQKAITAGVHTIEHGYLISEAEVYYMAEKEILWTPTLSPLGNILNTHSNKFKMEREIISRVYEEQIENIRKAVELGCNVVLGSDSGAYGVDHGKGLFDEMAHFEKIGLNRYEIEKMCLENGTKALKLDRSVLQKKRRDGGVAL